MIPPDIFLTPSAIDLIKKLLLDPSKRLGVNGVQEIKAHPFFFGINWKNIKTKTPPFVPDVTNINFKKKIWWKK